MRGARGTIHFRAKQNTPQGTDPKQIVAAIVDAVSEYKKQSGASENGASQSGASRSENDSNGLKAISLVVPGTVNVDAGTVVKAIQEIRSGKVKSVSRQGKQEYIFPDFSFLMAP